MARQLRFDNPTPIRTAPETPTLRVTEIAANLRGTGTVTVYVEDDDGAPGDPVRMTAAELGAAIAAQSGSVADGALVAVAAKLGQLGTLEDAPARVAEAPEEPERP